MEPRLCKCHGAPMQKNGGHRDRGRQSYRCAVRNNDRMADWYDNLSGVEYHHRQLKHRRALALARMRKRGGG